MINNISKFDNKTFFLDSSNKTAQNQERNTKSKSKKIMPKDVFITTAAAAAGGIIPNIVDYNERKSSIESEQYFLDGLVQRIIAYYRKPPDEYYIIKPDMSPYQYIFTSFYDPTHKNVFPYQKTNSILFIGQNEQATKKTIDWFARQTTQKYSQVDIIEKPDEFVKLLKDGEENYKKTGKWNFIYVKNMDTFLNLKETEDSLTASVKNLMADACELSHTTLLLQVKDIMQIDNNLIESAKISYIFDTDNMLHLPLFKDLYTSAQMSQKKLRELKSTKITPKTITHSAIGITIGALIAAAGLYISKKGKRDENNK